MTNIRNSLLTVKQFHEKHQGFPLGGLRWLLFHRQENGLASAVVRVGKRKLLVDEAKFFAWLEAQQNDVGRP